MCTLISLSLVFLGLSIEFAEQFHAFLELVAFHFLSYQELDAVFVVVAQHLHELVWLVVLATQGEYEYGACVRVKTDVAKHFACVLVVARKLRAAEVVVPRM